MAAAVPLFQRRVYRGAFLNQTGTVRGRNAVTQRTVEELILDAVEEHGTLGDAIVPDTSIRPILMPAQPERDPEQQILEQKATIVAPAARLAEEDMSRFLQDLEDDEEVDHLVLVVHGIGEMMRSMNVLGLAIPHISSIVEWCGFRRKNHREIHDAALAKKLPDDRPGRVEYLPVEWHEAFTILSQRRRLPSERGRVEQSRMNVILSDITLKTIPNLRDFANDTLMNALYFMRPEHHDLIIDAVTYELNVVFHRLRELTGFQGGISLIGHSLGSIIIWDILANQYPKPQKMVDQASTHPPTCTESKSKTSYENEIDPVSHDDENLAVGYRQNPEH